MLLRGWRTRYQVIASAAAGQLVMVGLGESGGGGHDQSPATWYWVSIVAGSPTYLVYDNDKAFGELFQCTMPYLVVVFMVERYASAHNPLS